MKHPNQSFIDNFFRPNPGPQGNPTYFYSKEFLEEKKKEKFEMFLESFGKPKENKANKIIEASKKFLNRGVFSGTKQNYLVEETKKPDNLPLTFIYNGLVYSYVPSLNVYINMNGHVISIAQATAFMEMSDFDEVVDTSLDSSYDGSFRTEAQVIPSQLIAPSLLTAYSYVPGVTNYLRYTQGFTTSVSLANGGWTYISSPVNSTTVSIDNSIVAPDGTLGAALLTVNNPTVIGGVYSIMSGSGVTANDYWSGSVWLRGKTATCGGINVVARKSTNQFTIPCELKILSGPGTVIPSEVGETHWSGVTGLSTTEWTRISWNNITGWGTTGFTDVLFRLTVNFYNGTNPSAVTGDSIYVWGAQFERNPYPTAYLAATGGSFSSRAFQGLTSQINLYWQDNSTNETGFYVERSTNGIAYSGITTLGVNTTVYNDIGLSSGTTYYYKVSAVGLGLTSSPAGPTYTNTYYTIPAAPSNLRILGRTQNSINIQWDDNSNNESGFYVYSSTDGISYNVISTQPENTTTYTDNSLLSGTTYYYQVNAFNPGGTSNFAGPTATSTLINAPSAPTGFTATNIDSNSVTLQFTDTSSNEDGFNIYYRQI